jgi:hypothetical protein
MRYPLLAAGLLGSILALRADGPAESASPPPSPAPPGYELRVLDRQKRVRFQVGASRVEVAVPVFVYCPATGATPAVRLLREAQASLMKLAAKPEWTADELRQVITAMDQAARLLETPAWPGRPVAAGED